MNGIRNWTRTLQQAISLLRQRLSLTIGLRRLRRWKSLLQKILLALREQLALRPTQTSYPAPKVAHLPQGLFLATGTLSWALETLEDLYLLVTTLELQAEEAIQRTSKLP